MNNQFDVIWIRAPKGTKSKWVRRAIQSGGSLSDYVLKAVNAHEAMYAVLSQIRESLPYMGDYDLPVGLHERIDYALNLVRNP